jgi:hypothetical protein
MNAIDTDASRLERGGWSDLAYNPPISRAEIDPLSWQHFQNKCAAGCRSVLPSYITQPLLLTAGLDFEVRSQKHRELVR